MARMMKCENGRSPLSGRVLSTILAGAVTMSMCGTMPATAFAADDIDIVAEVLQTEEVANSYSAAFATGDATIECNGLTITDHQVLAVSGQHDLVFIVTPFDGCVVEEVSFQLLSEGIVDVLEPETAVEGLRYTVSAEKLTEGMAIVVDTDAAADRDEAMPVSEGTGLSDMLPMLFSLIDREMVSAEDASADDDDVQGTYVVKHHLQNIDGTYACTKSESFEGKVGDEVQAQIDEYPLYVLNEGASTLTGTIPGDDASDDQLVLDLFYDHTALTVTGREPSANVKDVEKVYDGRPVSVEAIADKGGSTLMYYTDGMNGWSTENPRFTDAGTYTVLVKAIDPSDSETGVATAHVTVKPAPVVIKVRDAEKSVGSLDPAFEGDIEGLMPGDEIGSVMYYRLNNAVEDAGSYANVLSALVQHRNSNYTYTVVPGSFTIKDDASSLAQNSTISDDRANASRPGPVDSGLVTGFAQGEGIQRFTEDVVEPIATLVGVANADPAVIAALLGVAKADRTTITDDETPLAAFGDEEQKGPWGHIWIILGGLIVVAGSAVVVLRRLYQAECMDERNLTNELL